MRIALVLLLLTATVLSAQTNPASAPKPTILTAPSDAPPSAPLPAGLTAIFDGKTLDGWVMEPPNAASLGSGDIVDWPALIRRLNEASDPVSAYVNRRLDDSTRSAMATSPDTAGSREFRSALSKQLGAIVAGPSIYEAARFSGLTLRDETRRLLASDPKGRDLARLNRVLFEAAYPREIGPSPAVAWQVRNGVLESTGAGRGVIYTKRTFANRYRIVFDVRHRGALPGKDHQAAVLVFCTPAIAGEKPLDALGGIQFQVPRGGSWDYRKGKNDDGLGKKTGKPLFTRVTRPNIDEHQWSRVEILADPTTGAARMAVAQPPGAKAVEVLDFTDPTAAQAGPFALQMHNAGLFDEFANLAVEENPKDDELITMR